jgi:di/tricarboxylate transporter
MQERHGRQMARDIGIAEVLIPPASSLKGKTLRERRFRSRHQVEVIGLRRADEVIEDYLDERLRPGDTLLVAGPWVRIQHLHEDIGDFVVLTMPRELSVVAPARKRAPVAVASAMDISPYPLAMAVAIAASSAYVSPISSLVGTLVMEPGGPRYLDFVKAGVPLLVPTGAVAVGIIPLLFPF